MSYVVAVIGTPVALCAIFGNLLTIIAVYKTRTLRSRNSVLLTTNLAVVDLVFSAVCMPIAIIRTALDVHQVEAVPGCVLTMVIDLLVILISLVTLMFVSIDRYIAIATPMRYIVLVTRFRVKIAILGTWIWAAIVATSATARYKTIFYERNQGFCLTGFENMPSVAFVYLTFFGSFTVIVYCYWIIFKQARRHRRQIAALRIGNFGNERDYGQVDHGRSYQKLFKRESKAAVTIFVIIAVYATCLFPFPVTLFCKEVFRLEIPHAVDIICVVFVGLNSALNPLIYVWLDSSFRNTFKRLLCGFRTQRVSIKKKILTLDQRNQKVFTVSSS